MPIYNGETTLEEVFEHLEKQHSKKLIKHIFFINDNSTDKSLELLEEYKKTSSYSCSIITNKTNIGLANGYNLGINLAETALVITMHQDIVLRDLDSFEKIIKPFETNGKIGASYPTLLHPEDVWLSYNFWQRAMFSRFVGRKIPLLSGKFDCFSKSALNEIGLFDSKTFRTAGEDGDIKKRFAKAGYEMVQSNLEVVHVHNREKNFDYKKLLKKESQIAEAQGVLLRKYGAHSIPNFLAAFFRQILLIAILLPFINIFAALLIIIYCFAYSIKLYKKPPFDVKLFVLPIVNFVALPLALFFSLRGFITAKQFL